MDDMTFFHEGTLQICGSLDIVEVLRNCYVFLHQFMPLEGIELTVYDAKIGGIITIARAPDVAEAHSLEVPILLSPEARAEIEAHIDEVLIVHSESQTSVSREMRASLGTRDLPGIVLPLHVKEEKVGVVKVLSRLPNLFNTEHARLLKLLRGPFAIAMSNALRYREVLRLKELLKDDNRYLHQELHKISGDEIVGGNFGLRQVMESVNQVAPLDTHVLLLGETGVGKEIIANAIHYSSPRRGGSLIKVNCGAIPDGLLDSELFGHEKGAFTGATAMKRGRFERADGGTVFLDEIGELPPAAQVRLLRVLQDKTIERVGGTAPVAVNVRVIAATHRDLEGMVKTGEFRQDLWFRLNVFPITIPPLRERKADIPAFVRHFMERKARELNLQDRPALAPGAIERLQQYDWPGNVRELENAVERELIRSQTQGPDRLLLFKDMQPSSLAKGASPSAKLSPPANTSLSLNATEREHIQRVLQMAGGKVEGQDGAAALLGINPSTLRHRMRKLGIPFGRSR